MWLKVLVNVTKAIIGDLLNDHLCQTNFKQTKNKKKADWKKIKITPQFHSDFFHWNVVKSCSMIMTHIKQKKQTKNKKTKKKTKKRKRKSHGENKKKNEMSMSL